ncbi:MAG TPA: DegT/DnrJ/EryC1/StrS family aminotransferase [Candidatus Dormibacteraeota bacterium]|nr:DegT/DnrJ/EryC1/StrS family aminotransferase [Candidatus Dormibacteraeota bacterium]
MLTLQSRHRLDIRFRDFAFALASVAGAHNAERLSSELESAWSSGGQGLACRSVRSGFHLLLSALDLPAGAEVLVSAITHPDMVRILEAHGLMAVPVDLDVATLAPRLELAERLVTDRTRAILVAHLFGGRVDMEPVAAFAKEHRLLVWEDCAQAFTRPDDAGDSRADVSMYSFGALKTCTALGGALFEVRSKTLLARMRRTQAGWRPQRRRAYVAVVLKFLAFGLATRPLAYGLLARGLKSVGRDFDRLVNSSVRAFRAGELIPQLEVKPSAPLVAMLAYRLRTFDGSRLRRRAAAGKSLAAQLPDHLVLSGHRMEPHAHWLFPVVSSQPDELIQACRRAGIDAARGASSVSVVAAPPGRPDSEARAAERMMSGLVFLPAYPELSRRSLARLVTALESSGTKPATWPETASRRLRQA